jgi:predicted nucleotidyltransferase
MRLSTFEHQAIERAGREAFPAGTRVLLFGSRLDDARRGGDIDLLVELPVAMTADEQVSRRNLFTARLYRLLDERRIDVVMTEHRQPDARAVVASARQHGVELTLT